MTPRSNVITVNGVRLHYIEAGSGPAMVLLHGWPQTTHAWRKVIGPLAAHYRVVAPDLRGMGASDRPPAGYDMRTVATDIHDLIQALGLDNPYLVGHDWGGLVVRRFALDWPGTADRIAVLDIVPHEQVLTNLTPEIARGAWHYFFNAVPDLPEQLVDGKVEIFLRAFFRPKYANPAQMEEAIDDYVRAYSATGALRGGFSYYRAMLSENRALDQASAGQKIQEPVLAIWGNHGGMGGPFDVLAMWRREAARVRGRGIDGCGHYVPEESPEILVEELLAFGKDGG